MACNCVLDVARSQRATVSPNFVDHSLHVLAIMACNYISPTPLDHGQQVHHQCCLITPLNRFSKLTPLPPPCVSPHQLYHFLQLCTLVVWNFILPNTESHCNQVQLPPCAMPASRWISKLPRSSRPNVSLGSMKHLVLKCWS